MLLTRVRLPACLLLTLVLGACTRYESHEHSRRPAIPIAAQPEYNLGKGCADRYDPAFDYFPEKITFEHAQQVKVSYHGHYKVVDFSPSVHTHETFRFVLVQCGTPVPQDVGNARVIEVPVSRYVLNVAEFGSVAVQLGVVDRMVGVQSLQSYITPEILERGRKGQIREVGSRGHSPLEPTVAADPNVVFLFYSAYPDSNLHPQLWQMGVEGVPLASHFEPTPLGRSEWMKFFALFFNAEQRASDLFDAKASHYEDLAAKARGVTNRPQVLLGWPNGRDIWALNGGRNYMSRFIWDAGGEYFWRDDDHAGSLVSADYEQIFDQSSDTSVWLSTSSITRAPTRKGLIRDDARLAFFAPVERDGVYANDRGRDDRGATPWVESLANPELVLADLIHVLHPKLLPDAQPTYLRKLK